MEGKIDLRIRKTYLALTKTFLQMMEEMRFEDIRVNELCERAMVRKSTFYKHFADKYELLAFIVREIQEELNAQLAEEPVSGDRAGYYTKLVSLILDFLDEKKAFVNSVIRSNSFPLILNICMEQIMLDVHEKLKEDKNLGENLPASTDVMTAFFVGGLLEAVFYWLKKGKPINSSELKDQLARMIKQFYDARLDPAL